MSILLALIIGIAVGFISSRFLPQNADQIMLNMLMGVSGSIAGLVLAFFIVPSEITDPLISLPVLLFATIGASIFVLLFGLLHKMMPTRAAEVGGSEKEDLDLEKIDNP